MIIIVMRVSGSGKTTVGNLLSKRLGWAFHDGADYHSPVNKEKMGRGMPLTDDDRNGWLDTLAELISYHLQEDRPAMIACSALKGIYRKKLVVGPGVYRYIYIKGSADLIIARMKVRPEHYMGPRMLARQFANLEEPADTLTLDINQPPESPVDVIIQNISPGFIR
jgi:gluconokinase